MIPPIIVFVFAVALGVFAWKTSTIETEMRDESPDAAAADLREPRGDADDSEDADEPSSDSEDVDVDDLDAGDFSDDDFE